MLHTSLQERVSLFAATPLLTVVRVQANFDATNRQANSLVPVRRRKTPPKATTSDAGAPPMFEPTHEWKAILPNQVLPPGLHIRVNLQTGKKEAKLLD